MATIQLTVVNLDILCFAMIYIYIYIYTKVYIYQSIYTKVYIPKYIYIYILWCFLHELLMRKYKYT